MLARRICIYQVENGFFDTTAALRSNVALLTRCQRCRRDQTPRALEYAAD